jgi:hypothetical protein
MKKKLNLFDRFLVATLFRRIFANYNEFIDSTKNPREVQIKLLREILGKNSGTDYGKEHNFSLINSEQDFQGSVPVNDYDSLASYIERVKLGDFSALLTERPVMFNTTSGTTSKPKFLPVTEDCIKNYKRGADVWNLSAFLGHPEIRGKVLTMICPRTEGVLESGIPFGSASGLFYDLQGSVAKKACVAKKELFDIPEMSAKYYATMRIALEHDITHINTPNPSAILLLCKTASENSQEMIRDIRNGTLSEHFDIPATIREVIKLKKNRNRAEELERILEDKGELLPKDFWPNLALIGCWTGGTVGVYLKKFPELFGNVPVRDLGLLASEARMSIPLEDGISDGVLDIHGNFYEFIAEEEAENKNPRTLASWEIEQGKKYFIILTTRGGLYRYNISDLVEVNGFYNKTPVIKFLNKGARISSITGEKLTEYQIAECGRAIFDEKMDRIMVCPVLGEVPHYAVISDLKLSTEEVRRFDEELKKANIEYNSKRKLERLGNMELVQVSSEIINQENKIRPGRDAQRKPKFLNPDTRFYQEMVGR